MRHGFPCLLQYFIRSCKRFSLPCQNSIRLGITLYPPQFSGRSMGLSDFFFKNICSIISRKLRSGITALCSEIQALIWLSIGRDAKYASDSFLLTFSTIPSIRICRSNSFQKNTNAALGFLLRCLPLRLS